MNTIPPRRAARRLFGSLLAAIACAAGALWLARPSIADIAFLQDFPLTSTGDFLNGSFFRTGIVNNAGGEVQLLPIGVAGVWVTDTQQLPAARAQLGVAPVGSRIYALGGVDGSSLPTRYIYSSTVVGTSLTPWVTQTSNLPAELAGHAVVALNAGGNNFLHVFGGYFGAPSFAESDKIFYAPVNPNGSLGAWITNTVNLPVPLNFSSVVAHNNRIYLIGGIGSGAFRAQTYSAPLNGDGSIGAWSAESTLPQSLARSAAVVFQGVLSNTIYVLGGSKDALSNSPEVYFADILPGGTLSSWRASTGILPEAFNSHAAIQAAGQIYIIGGNTGGVSSNLQPRKIVLSALVDESNPNRRLQDFGGGQSSWVETEPLPIPRRNHGAAYVNGELFAVGGDSSVGSGFVPSRIAYHGPTTGGASKYAPSGNYLSPVINIGEVHQFAELAFSTVMTSVSNLTITVRYHTSTDGINWGSWSAMLPASRAQSANINDPKSITHTLNTPGQYFQYQAYFTTTANTLTPFFLESHLKVSIPPPDLTVRKSTASSNALPGTIISYTIVYTNQGGYFASGARLTETRPANTSYVDIGAGWVQIDSNRFVKTLPDIPLGGTGAVPFAVQVDNPLPPGTIRVTNTVQIGGDALETNFTNNSFALGTFVIPLVAGVDLRVTNLADGLSNPTAGQVVSYTMNYFNFGTDSASAAALTVTLPAGMSGSTAGGWIALGGGAFRLELGTLASAQGGSAGFGAQVDSGVAGGTFLTTTAQIGYAGADVDPNNNIAYDVDYVPAGNLSLAKDDGYALVDLSQTLVYTLTFSNHGGAIVSNASVTETPPLALVDVVNPAGWTQVGSAFVRSIGTVAPGAGGYVTFPVQVKANAPAGMLITNTAQIGAPADDQGQTGDNFVRDVDKIQPGGGPDLRILGVLAPDKAYLFQPATFYITVTNAGSLGTGTSFFLDLYVDNAPSSRSDLGQTFDTLGALGAGQTVVVPISWQFDGLGSRNIWFQVDTCDQSSPINCPDPSYGRVMESLESNNVIGPLTIQVQQSVNYLPFIGR